MDLMYACIAHPCPLPRLKGSGFCKKCKKESRSYSFKMPRTKKEAGR